MRVEPDALRGGQLRGRLFGCRQASRGGCLYDGVALGLVGVDQIVLRCFISRRRFGSVGLIGPGFQTKDDFAVLVVDNQVIAGCFRWDGFCGTCGRGLWSRLCAGRSCLCSGASCRWFGWPSVNGEGLLALDVGCRWAQPSDAVTDEKTHGDNGENGQRSEEQGPEVVGRTPNCRRNGGDESRQDDVALERASRLSL